MELKLMGHGYTIIPQDDGTYQVAMILSEHDNEDEAITARLEAMKYVWKWDVSIPQQWQYGDWEKVVSGACTAAHSKM
ncbi:MAG: hypothetical protein HPY74_08380 [Firmicutes bacterium]|nr:hypothetical protein [Bacillota bacterium]